MATSGHTVKAFDEDLGELRALVAEMGGLAEAAIDGAVQALIRRDLKAAAQIVTGAEAAERCPLLRPGHAAAAR